MTLARIDANLLTDNAPLARGLLGVNILSGLRNPIINGNFDIWQRATTQSTTGYGSDDRWGNGNSGSTKVHSQQLHTLGQTAVPGNPTFFSRTVVTSVAGASNYCIKNQNIEKVSTFSGRTVTLTFYAKADATKNIAIELTQGFGTGGSPSTLVASIGSQLIPLTTSWQKFTKLITVPSISSKVLGSNGDDALSLVFWFDAGSTWNSRTSTLGQQSGTFDISRVSIVDGDATNEADPFSPRHIQQELALCQRYYEVQDWATGSIYSLGGATGASTCIWYLSFQPKRVAPTVVVPGTIGPLTSTASAVTGTVTNTPNVINVIGKCRVDSAYTSGTVAGDASIIYASSPTRITIDAEL